MPEVSVPSQVPFCAADQPSPPVDTRPPLALMMHINQRDTDRAQHPPLCNQAVPGPARSDTLPYPRAAGSVGNLAPCHCSFACLNLMTLKRPTPPQAHLPASWSVPRTDVSAVVSAGVPGSMPPTAQHALQGSTSPSKACQAVVVVQAMPIAFGLHCRLVPPPALRPTSHGRRRCSGENQEKRPTHVGCTAPGLLHFTLGCYGIRIPHHHSRAHTLRSRRVSTFVHKLPLVAEKGPASRRCMQCTYKLTTVRSRTSLGN